MIADTFRIRKGKAEYWNNGEKSTKSRFKNLNLKINDKIRDILGSLEKNLYIVMKKFEEINYPFKFNGEMNIFEAGK